MKSRSGDGQAESTGKSWPCVPKMAGEEFEQSLAVAQLAVKLCDLKTANSKVPLEKENPDPEKYLADAWMLIQSAGRHVLRAQTDAEYLVAHGGSDESAERVAGRLLQNSRVRFEKLCNPARNPGDSETIHGVTWKVYRSERAFNNLFWAYWRECGKHWKNADLAKTKLDHNLYDERVVMAKLVSDPVIWRKRGESVLASWKKNGVPLGNFLALAKFRKERDNKRAANLKKKPKGKRRRIIRRLGK